MLNDLCDNCRYIEYFHDSCPARNEKAYNDAVKDYGIVDCHGFEWRVTSGTSETE